MPPIGHGIFLMVEDVRSNTFGNSNMLKQCGYGYAHQQKGTRLPEFLQLSPARPFGFDLKQVACAEQNARVKF